MKTASEVIRGVFVCVCVFVCAHSGHRGIIMYACACLIVQKHGHDDTAAGLKRPLS